MVHKNGKRKPDDAASKSDGLKQKLTIGAQKRITLITSPNSENNDEYIYQSTIMVQKDDQMIVTEPSQYENEGPIVIGNTLVAHYYDGRYLLAFNVVVIKRLTRNETSYLLLKITGEIERIQRRAFFRLEKRMEGKIQSSMSETAFDMVVKDISAGGASIQSPEPFIIGDQIDVYLPLGNEGEMIRYSGDVKRCISNVKKKDGRLRFPYNIGVQFVFRTVSEQEALFARIVKIQLEQRKSANHRG